MSERKLGASRRPVARCRAILTWLLLIPSPLLAASDHSPQARFNRPNIVVIVADDLGWNDVGYHGSQIATPNLDRLADEGVALERFYTAPFCSATRMGMLTGRWPIRWGMMHVGINSWETTGLPPEEETLAEQLAWEGYARRAFMGKWHVGHGRRDLHPLRQGFTEFYGHYNGEIDYFTHVHDNGGEVDWHRNFTPLDEAGYSTHLLTDEAVRFIERRSDRRRPEAPFLLVLSYNAPHSPIQAPADCNVPIQGSVSAQRRKFAAVVHCLDRGIGRVLAALDNAGLAEDTIVWFLSDNGGARNFGASNAPLRSGKFSLYEGGVRTPSIVRWPGGGLAGGRTSDAQTGYIDVLPTLRRMVRAHRPPQRPFDGIDVTDVLAGRSAESPRDWFGYRFIFSFAPEFMSITSGAWKLVRHGVPILWDPEFRTPVELFRIRDDPRETNDIADFHPDVVRSLLCKIYSFSALQPSYALPTSALPPDGWEPPERWEMPPDPDPAVRVDWSQNDFRMPPAPPVTAPGCPQP